MGQFGAVVRPLSTALIVRYFVQNRNLGDEHEAVEWITGRGVFQRCGTSTRGGPRRQSDLLERVVEVGVSAG